MTCTVVVYVHACIQVGAYDFCGESRRCICMHACMQVGEYDFYGESDQWTWMYNRATAVVVHAEEGSYDMFF